GQWQELHPSLAPARPHNSGVNLLHACNCGRRRTLRDDPFSYEDANGAFFRQECCEGVLANIRLPAPPTPGCTWSVSIVGSAACYDPSNGLLMPGFLQGRHMLQRMQLPPLYPPEGEPPADARFGLRGAGVANTLAPLSDGDTAPGEMRCVRIGLEHECARGHRYLLAPHEWGPVAELTVPAESMRDGDGAAERRGEAVVEGTAGRWGTEERASRERGAHEEQQRAVPTGKGGGASTSTEGPPKVGVEGEGRRNGPAAEGADAMQRALRVPLCLPCVGCASEGTAAATASGEAAARLGMAAADAAQKSQLQRVHLVLPPGTGSLQSRPMVRFEHKTEAIRMDFEIGCSIVFPEDSMITFRLPYVYPSQAPRAPTPETSNPSQGTAAQAVPTRKPHPVASCPIASPSSTSQLPPLLQTDPYDAYLILDTLLPSAVPVSG
ncbi:hypothetical protein CYMTET_22374, partial [Cymbomonas tetramitiformis]